MKRYPSEKGQAIVLILLGIIGIVSLTALAIDGGNQFADRRQAQNAADAAALAASLTRIRAGAWQAAGLASAATNGYNNDGVMSVVQVVSPPIEGAYSCANIDTTLPVGDACNEYVQVIIESTVNTWFAPIVGVSQTHNRVSAIARAKPGYTAPIFFGQGLVSLMAKCKSEYPDYPWDPFTVGGTGGFNITGSGVFINSACYNALTQNGGGYINTDGSITIVGNCDGKPGNISTGSFSCGQGTQIPYPPLITWPTPSCSGDGSATVVDANSDGLNDYFLMQPGYWEQIPPLQKDLPNVPGNNRPNTFVMAKGIYCVDTFDTGSETLSTDVNQNGIDDLDEGVLIYNPNNNNMKINAGGEQHLSAMKNGDYAGLLIFVPIVDNPKNGCDITINGNAGSTLIGTILAPSCHIKLTGGADSFVLNSQIIGFSIDLSGSNITNIQYDDALQYDATIPPQISLIQ